MDRVHLLVWKDKEDSGLMNQRTIEVGSLIKYRFSSSEISAAVEVLSIDGPWLWVRYPNRPELEWAVNSALITVWVPWTLTGDEG